MAPHDCVEKTLPICTPEACKLLLRKVPRVTNHPPQIKNSRNIITESCRRIDDFIIAIVLWQMG